MQLPRVLTASLLVAGAAIASPVHQVKRQDFDRYNATLEEFGEYALEVATSRIPSNSTCTADKISVRKSW